MPDASRKVAADAFKGELGKLGYELAQCGSATPVERLPEFNEITGYWDKPSAVTAKPTRWLFWLRRQDGVVIAEVPDAPGSRRLAFYTTAKGKVAGIFVRVVPSIETAPGKWTRYDDWEWTLFFVFPSPLKRGSSAQLIEQFEPSDGTFVYMGEVTPYVSAGIFTLEHPGAVFQPEDGGVPITYGEATAALQSLIKITPLVYPDTTAEG